LAGCHAIRCPDVIRIVGRMSRHLLAGYDENHWPDVVRIRKLGQQSRYQSLNNLKAASQMLIFLQQNDIKNMDDLVNFLKSMHNRQSGIREKLKPMERRMKTLDEHIKQVGYYKEFSKINRRYKQQKPKGKEAFFESHRREMTLFQAAERHLKSVLNGREQIPLATWEKEHATLTAERKTLNAEYLSLKDEVGKVEKIVRSVQDVLHEERPSRKRSSDVER